MVDALLGAGALTTVGIGREFVAGAVGAFGVIFENGDTRLLLESDGRDGVTVTPVWLAMLVYQSLLDQKGKEREQGSSKETKENMNVFKEIISKLLLHPSGNEDENQRVSEKWMKLCERRAQIDRDTIEQRVSLLGKVGSLMEEGAEEEEGGVVDLSVMTEEKPSGWKEGDGDMTQEAAMRTFLKYMRG